MDRQKILQIYEAAMRKFATEKNYKSHMADFFQCFAEEVLRAALPKPPAKILCDCDDGQDWSTGKAETCEICGGAGQIEEAPPAERKPFQTFTKHEVANAAILSGFSLATECGYPPHKYTPISDVASLKEFAERLVNKQTKGDEK